MSKAPNDHSEALRALCDPVRWEILRQVGEVPELPCRTLESTLAIAKPTISYHTKILAHAELISVRKAGRNFFYTLRRDILQSLVAEIARLSSDVEASHYEQSTTPPGRRRSELFDKADGPDPTAPEVDGPLDATLPTW